VLGTALCFFVVLLIKNGLSNKTSNVLCEGWQPKTTRAWRAEQTKRQRILRNKKTGFWFVGNCKNMTYLKIGVKTYDPFSI
jgi:hypothetical protein